MLSATLKGMLAHKLRVALTSLSIALGVGFVAGTLILSSSLQRAFDDIIDNMAAGVDTLVRAEATVGDGLSARRPPIAADELRKVAEVDGVAAAEGVFEEYAVVTDDHGKPVPGPTAQTYGGNWVASDDLRGSDLRSGHAPEGPDEVVLDATTARLGGFRLGDEVNVHFAEGADTFRLVGTVGYGEEDDLGGASVSYFDLATAQDLLKRRDYDNLVVAADAGVSEKALTERISDVISADSEALTGTEAGDELSEGIKDQLSFFTKALMTFAGIALFVGGFIIWNTFSMQVAQRSRELALLRAIGARRRQIMHTILTEAVVLGLTASAFGVFLGFGTAKGLTALMDSLGLALPSAPMALQPGIAVVSVGIGVAITVAAALTPARRATRVLPIEALRDSAPGAEHFGGRRRAIGVALTGAGIAALGSSIAAHPPMMVTIGGAVALMFGVLTLAPALVRPLVGLFAQGSKRVGITGDLAQQNATRNPRRTASTAMALVIGLTLVTAVAVFASSLKATMNNSVEETVEADLFVLTSTLAIPGFSQDITSEVASLEGVESVSATGYEMARVGGQDAPIASVDPRTVEEALKFTMVEGSLDVLDRGQVMITDDVAKSDNLEIGDKVRVAFSSGDSAALEVGAIAEQQQLIGANYVLSNKRLEEFIPKRLDSKTLVVAEDGVDVADLQDRVDAMLADHPDAAVMDKAEFQKAMGGMVDQLLTVVTVLLLMAVIIALLGIVNTLALSVFERTRELGLLRAIGMTRRQIRAMVRWESVVIAGMGTVLGTALGVSLGVTLVRALREQGFDQVAVPGVQLAVYVAAAAAAGILAAIGPARRAAKVDVLKAVVAD